MGSVTLRLGKFARTPSFWVTHLQNATTAKIPDWVDPVNCNLLIGINVQHLVFPIAYAANRRKHREYRFYKGREK